MAEPLGWKMGNFLEWRTYLPHLNRPAISPVFIINNTDCYFHLSRYANKYYYLYLKPKSAGAKLKSFPIGIYFDSMPDESQPSYPELYRMNFQDSSNYFFSFHEKAFTNRTIDMNYGFSVRFTFFLEQNVGLQLSSENKIEDKSTQADLLMSLHTDMEYHKDEKSTQADLLASLKTDVEYLSFDFGELLKSGNHSDVQMLCNGGNISAHKAVLAARSKTFSEMFQNNAEENKSDLINMATTEKSVMELCLEFIYKGKILNLPPEKASNLYVLGHVFKISSLMKMCADLMISNLSEDNYVPCLVLADKYNDDHFKCGITDYISGHAYLLKTEVWKKFSGEHMKTAIEVLQKCMLKFI